jgi:glutamate N-acetyltransferase/amino-acid N-acetyltransferase
MSSFDIFPISGGITKVDGFYCGGTKMGLKDNANDLGFIYSDTLCDVSSQFTTNRFQAAPLQHYQNYHDNFQTNFLLVNSKNANAMTLKDGLNDVEEIVEYLKSKDTNIINPIMSSTGVIGVRLPMDKIKNAIDNLDFNDQNHSNFVESIMTTDKFAKDLTYEVQLQDGSKFVISGVAKGAGMINPSMATMLCFITTDANIPKEDMDELLAKNVAKTFNAISVDGDTSTNDTVMLLANKKSGTYNKDAFDMALFGIMQHLSLLILKDGEGSTKVVAFEIKGAKSDDEALKISQKLSNSLLVKTALFGQDPNWGRIASTIGASGCEADEYKLQISFENILVYDMGKILMDKEIEDKASKVMKEEQFRVICNLNIGNGAFTSYGCDLGHEYVNINADYRT